jgi:hypothetical protein
LLARRRFYLAALLPFLIHPFHPIRNPAHAAFKKSYPQFGKTFRDATIDQSGKLNHRLYRPADGMHEHEAVEADFAGRSGAPVMHTERNIEPLKLIVNRPESLRAEVFFHSLSRYRDGG